MSIKRIAHLLESKQASSVEVTQDFLSNIKRLNPTLNAFITLEEDKTLAEAQQADMMRSNGTATPLTGIPIAHKDIFCAQGWRTTCASKMLSNFISPYDARVIAQFRQAGAVNIGKTNMDEFAMGSSTETSYFGVTRNPWQLDCVPGGSSGGSAVAVAAHLCAGATGTDTGGSIRQPASLCGVTGLKPTYGVVSRYGMIAFASNLDQAGPMAQSAEDCALMLNVMSGFDARDSTSIERPSEDYTRHLALPLDGLTIGLPQEFFTADLNSDMAHIIETALQEYIRLGAKTIPISLPNTALAIPVYYVLAPAEASSNLARYDGVRYGHRAEHYDDLMDMYCQTRAEGFGNEVKRRILIGTYVLSAGYYASYYLKAQQIRRLIADDFVRAFEQCDVIMGPVAPATAFAFNTKIDDPLLMYLQDAYTISTSLAGLPAMSIPAGFHHGLPVGLQLIGNHFSEARLLNIAHQYQQVTAWHTAKPPVINPNT